MKTPNEICREFAARLLNFSEPLEGLRAYEIHPFSEGFIAEMLTALPPTSAYKPMPHPDSMVGTVATRLGLPLNDAAGISPFWANIAQALRLEVVRHTVALMLKCDPATMHPAVALLRDTAGYKIDIHPDSARKVATVQIYLARDQRAPHLGVRFYREGAGLCEFIETNAIPYLPGYGYMFARTDHSWHGVNEVLPQDGERNSLMLVYFNSPKTSFT